MLDLSTCLKYYKRPEIQEAMVKNARGRELSVKYSDKGFGKRPDILSYPDEVLEFAKNGVTSFHVSEERWINPLELHTGMKRKDQDELRDGWDLVIDIDSKNWNLSKIATHLIVKSLKDHDIKSISVKFSGNKGFHIGVPFESFPEEVTAKSTAEQFPELPKKIAEFLLEYIKENYLKETPQGIYFDDLFFTYDELHSIVDDKVPLLRCKSCKRPIKKEDEVIPKVHFVCPMCQHSTESEDTDYMKCEKCGSFMEKLTAKQEQKSLCKCGSNESEINPLAVIDVDTLLISSRHMYRCSYSLHEKSGLGSVVIDPNEVMNFEKEMAKPHLIQPKYDFLDTTNTVLGEGRNFLFAAMEFKAQEIKEEYEEELNSGQQKKGFEDLQDAAPAHLFPPCITRILTGLEDGKKRALFVLYNFLKHVGWSKEEIDKLVKDWNKKNPEGMREAEVMGHLRYHQYRKILPPNCSNHTYYRDLHLCNPDNLCGKIKNPVNYTRRKVFAEKVNQKINKKKKSAKKETQTNKKENERGEKSQQKSVNHEN